MSKAFQIPVLLLLFNRPAHTKGVLDRLRQLRPANVYIHCDAARDNFLEEEEKVEMVRKTVAKHIDWPCETHFLYRTHNMGLREGVYGALNWFFNQVDYGIIIEDDCLADLSFFYFCEALLVKYADNEQMMHIGGSNLSEAHTATLTESYVFTRFSFVWGWASWSRAWKKMALDLQGLDEFEQQGFISTLVPDKQAQHYMMQKFKDTQQRKNNSWAYAWFYSILKNNGLCIVPKINLVQNTGIGDESATHTTAKNTSAQRAAQSLSFPIVDPNNYDTNPRLESYFFYNSQKSRFRLKIWYWLQKLRSYKP